MNVEELEELASARRFAYGAFQRLTGDEPTAEVLAALDFDVLSMAFEIVGVQPGSDIRVDAVLSELKAAPNKLDQLKDEYARIFVGPATLPAPPWESVYRDNKRLIMTATTLSVRESYRRCGYEARLYRHVPDDHLAIELDFLSSLAQDALDACHEGNIEQAQVLFDAGTAFVRNHLTKWAGLFAADVREQAKSSFYAAVADAIAVFAAADCGR